MHVQSGGLLLSDFIRFLMICSAHEVNGTLPALDLLFLHTMLIKKLLAYNSLTEQRQLRRGASVHARCDNGLTQLQSWCSGEDAESADGILMLHEAGADFDAAHPGGLTALWNLRNYTSWQVLRELAAAG